MKSLNQLRKQNVATENATPETENATPAVEAAKTENPAPAEAAPVKEKKAKKEKVEGEAKPETQASKAVSKAKEIYPGYVELLSDGEPHLISSILDKFELPHTSSGREVIRQMNRMILSGQDFEVMATSIQGEGKAWKLIEKSPAVEPAPVAEAK